MNIFSRSGRQQVISHTAKALAVITACAVGLAFAPDEANAKRKRSRSHKQSVIKKPAHPLLLVVSLEQQRVSVFDGTRLISRSKVSSGKSGHRTPRGIFSILQKHKEHYSNLYNDAPMPFMQRLTWSGIALHQGRVPNYPASHGCIRLPGGFANNLFRITSRGTRVIVTGDPVEPQEFEHGAMFKPLPPLGSLVHTAALETNSTTPPSSSSAVTNAASTATNASPDTGPTAPTAIASIGSANKLWLTRAQLKALRDAKFNALIDAIEFTKDKLDEAKEIVVAKRRTLKTAGRNAVFVKNEIHRLKREERKAVKLARRATGALKSFELRFSKKTFDPVLDAIKITAATLREDKLEARYFDLAEGAYIARQDTRAMKKQLPSYQDLVRQARVSLRDTGAKAKQALADYRAAKAVHKKARRAEKRRNKPIAIFISRKKSRLYVRQGYKPIYETPVTIANADQPIGTHVYTALRFSEGKKNLTWSVVSFDAQIKTERTSKRRKRRKTRHVSYRKIRADHALERIEIPEAARYQIAQLIKPGSSLIISDKRANNETGKYTDFIVTLD